ncbi:tetraspanin-8 isoform X1 [Gadus morhua]|uniref:Tetraspanin-8-like n=1 Tax=Gadus morhua TaxID=8049 RepID=A0A8C5C6C1_GADMO|nr:tetraspanin-8-like isoform X1 [Gadus morhua]
MSKVNACLKRSFIILTCLIGLLSGLTFGFTLFGHGFFHSTEEIEHMIVLITVMYAVAVATLLLAAIGVYGAAKDTSWPLIIFSTGMSLTVLFVAFDIMAIVVFKTVATDILSTENRGHWVTPLDTANGTNIAVLNELQETLMCCGVDKGYQDWGDHIHHTCVCTEDLPECIPAPKNSSLYDGQTSGGTIMIYKQPCIPALVYHAHYLIDTLIAILSMVFILLSTSLVLAILILVQLRRKLNVPPVYYSAEAKAGNYSSLGENGDIE